MSLAEVHYVHAHTYLSGRGARLHLSASPHSGRGSYVPSQNPMTEVESCIFHRLTMGY